MRRKYLLTISAMALSLCVLSGCHNAQNVTSETTATAETAKSIALSEPVSDETWQWLVQTYQLMDANYPVGNQIIADGIVENLDDAKEVTAEAQRLLTYGTQCGREDLTEEAAQELLYEMISACDNLTNMITANGGTMITMDAILAQEETANPAMDTEVEVAADEMVAEANQEEANTEATEEDTEISMEETAQNNQ